ncbi:DUF6768 family protein [Idiomarina seosinensis]|uniref:Uncharacterized protein n=1 Tax=Idiomarina seosinensis TaxID=281739 RepID=A0A432ZHE4_9GAMM|nr:DUF6768 family protein [Idiomarina seosinensis]RUO77323.1 hypothetical protein CWI81_02240 [Idiomarina seosinensis]
MRSIKRVKSPKGYQNSARSSFLRHNQSNFRATGMMTMTDNDRTKEQVSSASQELDELMKENQGITGYLKLGFQSSTAGLVKLSYVLAILLTAIIFFTGYKFFNAEQSQQVFWGVCLILSFNAQVATKLWIFSQSNRNFIAKEIRLMELRLKAQR